MHSKAKKIANETILVSTLVNYLNLLDYEVFIEVPNMGQSTDIVARKNRWLTFIEAKRHDWKKGIEQCKAHEAVADFIYLAVSSVNISDELLHTLRLKGYGLLHCDPYTWKCRTALKATLNRKVWMPQRNVLRKSLRSINNEH